VTGCGNIWKGGYKTTKYFLNSRLQNGCHWFQLLITPAVGKICGLDGYKKALKEQICPYDDQLNT